MTPHLRDLFLITPKTGVFDEISPIVLPLSRSHEISYEMRCVIVVPFMKSHMCNFTHFSYFVHYDTQNLILSYVATVSTNENTGHFQVLQDVRFAKNI